MFHLSESDYEVRETKDKGRGVFAKKIIPAGAVIGQYIGTLLIHEDSMKTESEGHFHMHMIDNIYCLADKNKPGIHLINHSCAPCCGVEDYKAHAVFFALRTIHPGEEITISYGLGKPDKYCNPCYHACHCESQFCRGSWHTANEDYDMTRDRSDEEFKETRERMARAVGTVLEPLADIPSHYADDEWFDLYASEHLKEEHNADISLPPIREIRSRMRQSGRPQMFPSLGITILAVQDNMLCVKRNE